jgi:proteasome lid subunit RPN8/RPN11
MGIAIARRLLDQIIAQAAAEPEREVCGLLLGDEGEIRAVRPAANIAADPARRFELDPQVLFAAIRAERAGGLRVIGHYHSHPNGIAAPSARDAAEAEPGQVWLIVAGAQATLWRAEAGGAFRQIELH